MPQTKKIQINRHIERTVTSRLSSKRTVVTFTLAELLATAQLNQQGNVIHNPNLKADDEEYVIEHLVNPIAQVVHRFKERPGLPSPHVALQFCAPEEQHQSEPSDQKRPDFPIESPRWGLDRVILPSTTKNQLEVVLSLIEHRHLMYEVWNLKSIEASTAHTVTLNFYGLSGTGKTLGAEAVAHYLGKKILRVNYPQLESSLVGHTNKNIHDVFQRATEEKAVLFFDEADSVLGKRLSSVTQSADHAINMARSVMLIELEKFRGVVIFATNFVQNYDLAFARRLLHFVQFDLPDEECRRQIFDVHLPHELPIANEVSRQELASMTEGFSGGEIRNVVLKASAKAAKQPVADSDKLVRRRDFIEAIGEVRNAKQALVPSKSQERSSNSGMIKVKPN